ncbi:hypothetical protein ADL26_20670, partial [Thermoactinomyces vulgaris]
GGDGDDARVAARFEQAEETPGEREVAEVVGGELALVALRAERARRGHDAGVVHEEVEPVAVGVQTVGELGHRVEVFEVERADLEVRARVVGADVLDGLASFDLG